MSKGTVNVGIARIGDSVNLTGYDFGRGIATAFNEHGYNRDCIEPELADGNNDEMRAVYNKVEHLYQRR